jgi:hypothetical protein
MQIPNNAKYLRIKPFAASKPFTVVNIPGVVNKKELGTKKISEPKRPAVKLNFFQKS